MTFPIFVDANVHIFLSEKRKYSLHRRILTHNSTTLAQLLTDENAVTTSSTYIEENRNLQWLLYLRYPLNDSEFEGSGELVTTMNYPVRSCRNEQYTQSPNKDPIVFQHYHNILGSYYGEDVELDEANMTTLLHSVTGLICVADYLQSMKAISKAIDNKLLSQGPVLYRSIANSPILWMNTAYSIRSEVILKEALIHLVGNWNAIEDHMKAVIHPEMKSTCKVKLQELISLKRNVNSQILGQYPEHIQREPGSDEIGRASYSNDIMTWMAIAVFRQYVGQAIARGLTFEAEDGGFEFYHKLNTGGQAYLDRSMVRQFHYRFPMSSKGQIVLENHLDDLKKMIKPFIQGIICNRSQLDISKYPVPYLTCLEVGKFDIPWIRDRLQAKISWRKTHY